VCLLDLPRALFRNPNNVICVTPADTPLAYASGILLILLIHPRRRTEPLRRPAFHDANDEAFEQRIDQNVNFRISLRRCIGRGSLGYVPQQLQGVEDR
jgi:hypothetical protein